MIPFQFVRPESIKTAIETNTKNIFASYIAGGTNIVDLMKRGVTSPEKLIDITALSLKTIEQRKEGLYLGALILNSEAAEHELVVKQYPLLSLAIKSGATQQIRNMATTGGNILQRTRCGYFFDTNTPCNKRVPGSGCSAMNGYNRMHAIFGASEQCIAVHPSDMCVALSALDATIIIKSNKGERKVPFIDFHRLPGSEPQRDNVLQKGELITGVIVPPNNFAGNSAYLKVRDRSSYAFALVSAAAALQIHDGIIKNARLAMGGVAHKPWRLFSAEHYLLGKKANESTFQKAAIETMKGAVGHGFNNFKLKMAPNTIVQSLKQASGIV